MVLTKRKMRQLVDLERSSVLDRDKTAMMFQLERRFGSDIVSMLDGHYNGDALAKNLGVDKSTISKWRKRFNISVVTKGCFWCGMRIADADKICGYCETKQ